MVEVVEVLLVLEMLVVMYVGKCVGDWQLDFDRKELNKRIISTTTIPVFFLRAILVVKIGNWRLVVDAKDCVIITK